MAEPAAGDDRVIRESGVEARIALMVGPALRSQGFRLVRVRLGSQNGLTLQVMAERADGMMTVEDCEAASHLLSPVLDVEDPIDKAYNLEVSSPGIDRPLVRLSDFEAAVGHLARIETNRSLSGRRRFRGRIAACGETSVTIEDEKAAEEGEAALAVPFEAIAEARLVLTDDLVREALKKDKQARRERKKRRRAGGLENGMMPDGGEEPPAAASSRET